MVAGLGVPAAPAVPGPAPASHPVTLPGSALPQVVTIFSLVEVVLRAEATALKYSAVLKRPGTEGLLDPQEKQGCDHHSDQWED